MIVARQADSRAGGFSCPSINHRVFSPNSYCWSPLLPTVAGVRSPACDFGVPDTLEASGMSPFLKYTSPGAAAMPAGQAEGDANPP